MNRILLIVLILSFSPIKSAEILKSWSELERRGNTFFKKKTNKPFTGILKNFYPDGQVSLIDNFKDGKQHGEYVSYHPNGKILLKGKFKDGKKDGLWSYYDEEGNFIGTLEYEDGKLKAFENSPALIEVCDRSDHEQLIKLDSNLICLISIFYLVSSYVKKSIFFSKGT